MLCRSHSWVFFKIFFFFDDHIFKSLLNLSQYYFHLMFWFFGHEACRIIAPQPGIEPEPPYIGRWSLNYWITRKVPWQFFKTQTCLLSLYHYLQIMFFKLGFCNAGDLASIPGSERAPREGNGNPLQYSCLENSMDRGAWWATIHGVAESQTWLSE